ncbi:MFS transporter [Microbacterium aoyamense]|uniref:MFS transporter n=1 Tax=Microbacterium aoyamense TaxID=344166 RepID=A0ABP5ASE1_9MICO|nr:MFS transporter [Microbacterium aoyamense]
MPDAAAAFVSPPGGWLWRPLVGIGLGQLALGIARPAFSYAALDLGADALMVGVLVAAAAVMPVLIAIPLGTIVGRLTHIAIIPVASALLLAASFVLAAMTRDLWALVLASALMGAAHLGLALGGQGWISRSAPAHLYNSGFGWMSAAASLGQTIGPVLSGIVVGPVATTREGISAAFWIAAGVAVVLAGVFTSSAARHYSASDPGEPTSALAVIRAPGVLRYVFVSAAVLTAVDLLTAYLPVVGQNIGLTPFMVGLLLGVRGTTSMISRMFMGLLSRRWSSSDLLLWSTAGSAAALIATATSSLPVVLFAAMVIGGFFLGIGQPLSITVIIAALPPRARSRALGVRMLGNQVAQVAVPVVAGVLAIAAGPAVVFLAQAAGLLAASGWELSARKRGSA